MGDELKRYTFTHEGIQCDADGDLVDYQAAAATIATLQAQLAQAREQVEQLKVQLLHAQGEADVAARIACSDRVKLIIANDTIEQLRARLAFVDRWREVVDDARNNICAGGLAENRQHEESIVLPHLDAVWDELEALEKECGNCFEGKSDLDHTCPRCNGSGRTTPIKPSGA